MDAVNASSRTDSHTRNTRKPALDDQQLALIADECWNRAGQADSEEFEADARTAVASAVKLAARINYQHQTARKIIDKFLRTKRTLLVGAGDPFTRRLHRAIWLMTQRLFETSIYDPATKCQGECLRPMNARPSWHCPSADDPTRSACANSLVFPYLITKHDHEGGVLYAGNQQKAARAVVRGFEVAGVCRQPNGDLHHPTEEAVRKVIARFPDSH